MSKKDPEDPLLIWERVTTAALFIAIILWFLTAPYK